MRVKKASRRLKEGKTAQKRALQLKGKNKIVGEGESKRPRGWRKGENKNPKGAGAIRGRRRKAAEVWGITHKKSFTGITVVGRKIDSGFLRRSP